MSVGVSKRPEVEESETLEDEGESVHVKAATADYRSDNRFVGPFTSL